MSFIRSMLLVFGWLLLLFAGGCAVTALVMLGPGWVMGSRDKILVGFIKFSLLAIAVSGPLGWWLVAGKEWRERMTRNNGLARKLALLFGALLLLYAGGCALSGIYMFGTQWARTGLSPFRGYNLPFVIIGGANVVASALLGWFGFRWGQGKLPDRSAYRAARIIGALVMLGALAFILFDFYMLFSIGRVGTYFFYWLKNSLWTLVFPGLPGWLLWRWGRGLHG